MTTPELLAACRAALAEQKAIEAAAHPAPWVDIYDLDIEDAAEVTQSRNADPARLAVAEMALTKAEREWADCGELAGDASFQAVTPRTQEQLWGSYGCHQCFLSLAAQLLGVVVD